MNYTGVRSYTANAFNYIRRHPRTFLFGGGLITGAACSAILPPWLLFISLVPLWSALSIGQEKVSSGQSSLTITTLFFAPFFLVVMSWILDINVQRLVGVSHWLAILLSFTSLLLSVIVLTSAMLPGIYALKWIQTKRLLGTGQTIALVAFIWVLSEWLRSVIFSVFLYGKGATIGDMWNFGSVGLAFMNTPLRFISPLAGLYGVAFVIIVCTLVFYYALITDFNKNIVRAAGLLVLLVGVVAYAGYKFPGVDKTPLSRAEASVFEQTDTESISPADFEIKNGQKDKKDVIVLPEGTYFYEQINYEALKSIRDRLTSNGIVLGVKYREDLSREAAILALDDQGRVVANQGKRLLIPIGEYLPWAAEVLLRLTMQNNSTESFNKNRAIQQSQDGSQVIKGKIPVGAVACSGILDRAVFRRLSNEGAQVFTNSASLSLFADSKNYLKQSYQMAAFHAVANKRAYVQSSNGGASFVLDPSGNYIVKPVFDNEDIFEDFSFAPVGKRSLYTVLGEWVLAAGAIFICILIGLVYWKNATTRPNN